MDLSIFLGAFLGFCAGLLTQGIFIWWHRRDTAKLHRNLLTLEVTSNLTTLDSMLVGIDQTKASGFIVTHMVVARPRNSVLHSIASSNDTLLSLSPEERSMIVQLEGHIDHVLSEYDDWPQSISDADAMQTVRTNIGEQPIREFMTEQLRNTLRVVMRSQMGLLVLLLNNSRKRDLMPTDLAAIWTALAPTRRNWRRSKVVHLAIEAPTLDQVNDQHMEGPIVAWRDGYPDAPIEIIELKPLVEGVRYKI